MAKGVSFMDEIIKGVKDTGKILHSNEAINKIGTNFGGAFEVGEKILGKQKMGIPEALESTFKRDVTDSAGKVTRELNYGKIAGSYIGASAAARVVTGGGVYKDRNGNGNLAGVPFI